MKTSVVIPARNEAPGIAETVRSVLGDLGDDSEVVVVDNGSTDATAALAAEAGARVIKCHGGSIAGVRNAGVRASSGAVLVFIDADVRVLPGWHERFVRVRDALERTPMQVTGARLLTSGDGGFLERHWFARLTGTRSAYINSGHLITTRTLFDLIGGFDDSLQTAEDYDFCVRAKQAGAAIAEDSALAAVHDGYPASWWRFIRREAWHGGQDYSSWSRFVDSKVAWVAAVNGLATIATVIAMLAGYPLAGLVYLIGLYALCLVLTRLKFPERSGSSTLATALVFCAYLWGRTLAILPLFRRRQP